MPSNGRSPIGSTSGLAHIPQRLSKILHGAEIRWKCSLTWNKIIWQWFFLINYHSSDVENTMPSSQFPCQMSPRPWPGFYPWVFPSLRAVPLSVASVKLSFDTTVLLRPSSIIHHPSSLIRHPSSIIHNPSSIIIIIIHHHHHHPSSIIIIHDPWSMIHDPSSGLSTAKQWPHPRQRRSKWIDLRGFHRKSWGHGHVEKDETQLSIHTALIILTGTWKKKGPKNPELNGWKYLV
jgi:hypothetical protein